MSNLNVQLSGAVIQVVDNTGAITRASSLVGTLLTQATAAMYDAYFQVGTSPISMALPATTIWVAFVRNQSLTATVTVTVTPTGQATSAIILVPGAVYMYWAPYSAAPATGGITALSLTASALATPVEILLAQ